MTRALAACLLALAAAGSGCDRELRKFDKQPSTEASPQTGDPQVALQPGQKGAGLAETSSSRSFDGRNAYELAQGKRLFRWYNCSGCHSQGGGGMGPALMDGKWLYGHEPERIFATIMEGRPNGMPSFKGRIPEEQVWQLVGYVRSMSGLAPKAAAPGRSDSIGGVITPESRRPALEPQPESKKP